MPHFAAWAVRHFGDADENRPLVVIHQGKVIAHDESASKAGIEIGMRVARARMLCPEVQGRLKDQALEAAAWSWVRRVLNKKSPFLESSAAPFFYVEDIAEDELFVLAQQLNASIALGATRALATLGAVSGHAGQICVFTTADYKRFPLERLMRLGFQEAVVDQLKLMGYSALSGVPSLRKRHLELLFGEEGKRLYSLLHPRSQQRVGLYRPERSIITHETLDTPCTEPHALVPLLALLAQEAADKLSVQIPSWVTVYLRPERGSVRRDTFILTKTMSSARALFRLAERLFTRLLEGFGRAVEIETVALELGGLRTAPVRQLSLFDGRSRKLKELVATVHRKYPGSLCRVAFRPETLLHEDNQMLVPLEGPAF